MSVAAKVMNTASSRKDRYDSKYSCMLFDVDNTLIDTDPLILRILRRVSSRNTHVIISELRSASPQMILRKAGYYKDRAIYRNLYTRMARTATLLATDTPEVLSQLRYRGVKLGIVTSSPRWAVDLLLANCDLSRFFGKCLVTYGTCRRRKPFPDPIANAMSKLLCKPNEVLFVGDSENDALASKNAGVCFGLATWGRKVDRRLATVCHSTKLNHIRDLLKYAP